MSYRNYLSRHKVALAVSLTSAAALLVACGGSGDGALATTPLPQLTAATPSAFSGTCADLAPRISSQANTSITAVTTVAAGSLTLASGTVSIEEHCRVQGSMFTRVSPVDGQTYAIGFEMRLPKNWNGRFFHQGNGGLDGNVGTAQGNIGGGVLTNALKQGFAVLSSDAGHNGAQNTNAMFGLDPQARADYGYAAVGKLTPMAKSVINAAYGKAPDRSYFGGCSNGGRHAMVAASRYPTDYDGYLAGAPGYNLPKAAVANIAGALLYASNITTATVTSIADLATAMTDTERKLVSNAVLAQCDALDGAADGLIQDTNACQAAFDINRDVRTCTGARDGTCLTAGQKTTLAKVFSGPTTSSGALIYSSFPWDSGYSGGSSAGAMSGVATWEFDAPFNRDASAVAMIFNTPPGTPAGFNGFNYVLGANIDTLTSGTTATSGVYTESAMSFMAPPNPTQLGTLKNRGAKIMAYHGVGDAIFSVNDTESWIKGLNTNNGGDASNFARLFRVPGMGHCSGGPSTDQFDMLTPLVAWVERGVTPDSIIATARGAGNAGGVNADVPATWAANRTRPLCAYPKVARYKGSGSVEEAANFSCQ